MTEHADTAGRTDPDYYERSPSTGAEETAELMGVEYGLGTPECDTPDCERDPGPIVVDDVTTEHARESVRCSTHAKDLLEVST